MDIADRIFELVDKKYEEQRDFASEIGVGPSMVSAWKNGKSESYMKRLPKIAEVLNTSVEYLMNGEKNPAPSNGSGLTLDDTRYNELSEENRALIDQMIAKLYQAQSDK